MQASNELPLVLLSTINPCSSFKLWSFINRSFVVPFLSELGCDTLDTRSIPIRRLFRFGLFEADLDLGTLTRQGLPVKLQEQPFRILALLLESSGEIVTREELRKKIWPDGTYVEFDGSMNTALMKLRAALNDSADNPLFIETVPRTPSGKILRRKLRKVLA